MAVNFLISDAKDVRCYVLNDSQLTPLDNLYGLDKYYLFINLFYSPNFCHNSNTA
jgi:hypothetical protein